MPSPLLERLRAARLFVQRADSDLDALVRAQIGLHSTDYATPYLSAWARLPRVRAGELYRRLNTGDGLVRVNGFRNTVHVVHADDLPVILAATGPAVRLVARRSPGLRPRSDAEVRHGIDTLVAALDGGPLGTNDLKAALPGLAPDLRFWLLAAMGEGRVVRTDAVHARSNRTRYARTERWIAGFRPWEGSAEEARRLVLRRAVEAFGPLTEDDLAWWLPAPKGEVRRALAAMGAAVTSLDHEGVRYWYAPALEAVAAPPREALGAWALPYEDALVKGYVDREWMFGPGVREKLFPFNAAHWAPPAGVDPGPGPHGGANVSGEARPSLWWRGRVVGRWEEADGGVVYQLHVDVGREGEDALAACVEGLATFLREGLRPIA